MFKLIFYFNTQYKVSYVFEDSAPPVPLLSIMFSAAYNKTQDSPILYSWTVCFTLKFSMETPHLISILSPLPFSITFVITGILSSFPLSSPNTASTCWYHFLKKCHCHGYQWFPPTSLNIMNMLGYSFFFSVVLKMQSHLALSCPINHFSEVFTIYFYSLFVLYQCLNNYIFISLICHTLHTSSGDLI